MDQANSTLGGTDLLCQARDAVSFFEMLIENACADMANAAEAVDLMQAEAGTLRRHYSLSEHPLIGILVRRLSSFLSSIDQPTKSHIDDLQTYVDVLRGVLDGEIDFETDQAEFARSLPVFAPLDVEGVDDCRLEVILADPHRAAAKFIERMLAKRGMHVTVVHHAFEALELALRTKPDLVISSGLLDVIAGADLARMLRALPQVGDMPVMLVTSLDPSHRSLQGLPPRVSIIHKNDTFSQSLDNALRAFDLWQGRTGVAAPAA